MQKKLIAIAVAGLLSGAAFAQTSVTIGGKFDAGYQFKRTANADSATGGATGGTTTATLGDGGASTSRITFGAREDLGNGMSAGVSLDMRFGTIEEGKNAATGGGINANDKKAMYFTTPVGTLQFGVINLGDNFYLADKPYMVSPKDLEIVKYGITSYRTTALTNRLTEYRTPTINLGPVAFLTKVSFAYGDGEKSGANDVAGVNSANAYSGGLEFKVGSMVNGGYDYLSRANTSATTPDGMRLYRIYTSIMPVKGLKIGYTFANINGYGVVGTSKAGFQDKTTNLVVAYNLNDKLEVGMEYGVVRDLGQQRNSGRGWMLGGAYFLSKNTYVYAATQRNNWESNGSAYGGKYDGTAANFAGTASKADQVYNRIGMVKEF